MRTEIWLPLAILAADRITKELSFRLPDRGLVLIPEVLGLRFVRNRGVAFSLLSGVPWLPAVLSLLIVLAGILFLYRKKPRGLARIGLLLMLGGALGNLLDRLFRGFVPDMIETLFIPFPVFNVADIFLTAGCALVIISLLFRSQDFEAEGGSGCKNTP